MFILFQTLNALAFTFVAYLLADVLTKSLKGSELLKPIAITLCSITISYHLLQTGGSIYVLGSFVGFFLHTCANAYVKKKKVKSSSNKRDPKVVNINP